MGDEDPNWCDLSPACNMNEVVWGPEGQNPILGNASNGSDACDVPFCPNILSYSINDSQVRAYDLFLLFCSILFLGFLFIRLAATIKKLHDSLPLFRLLYFMTFLLYIMTFKKKAYWAGHKESMFLIPIMSCAYEVTSLVTSYRSNPTKVMHVFLRGSILMTELTVVIFGIFIKLCGNSAVKLTATVIGIVAVSVVFTTVEGVLEFAAHMELACESFKFFTHGGMVFLFSTSILFAVAYAAIFLVYILNLYRRWDLPTKKSFYRYALFLCLVNVVQAVGSVLWFTGKHRPVSGNTGICLTVITNIIYVVTFAPVVYWIFLSNYFRMNDALKSVEASTGKINADVPGNMETSYKKSTTSNPLDIGRKKRGLFADHTSLIAESYETSSSYGSLDEETFVRHEPDK